MDASRQDGTPRDEPIVVPPRDLRVSLFGPLDVRLDGEPVRFDSGRSRALVGYLVLHPDGAVPREQLAFDLWPGSTEAQARTNLRKALHSIRRDAPDVDALIEISPRALRWRREHTVALDVDAFDEALDSAAIAPGAEDIDALTRAVTISRGDLLTGCWDDWVIGHRERYRDRRAGALRRLAHRLIEDGRPLDGIPVARELVRVEPLQDSSYRALMRLHLDAGDPAAATRVYHECVSTLREELGVDPSAETVDLYRRALLRPVDDDHRAAAPRRGGALIGRAAPWDRLVGCFPRDAAPVTVAVVTGEPGVGKTHLVDAFATWCEREGAAVARARSFPTRDDLGFGVATAWLRAPTLAGPIDQLHDGDRARLATLLPELGEPLAEPATPGAVAEHRQRLLELVVRLLAPPPNRAVVLVADDAHWADEPSVQLLGRLARQHARLLIVCTARREELPDAPGVATLLRDLGAAGQLVEVPLERLAPAGTAELARALLEPDVALDGAAIAQLHGDSAGNPLFIVEAVRAGWPDEPSSLTPRLRSVITARAARLDPDTRAVLEVAVTVGRAFRVAIVREAAGTDDRGVARALDDLWRRGFIGAFGSDAYDFTHGKLREAIYDEIGRPRRAHLHRALAAAHLEVDAASLDAVSGQIAYHLDRGGEPEEAIAWYRRAARHAQRRYANEEAVRLLEQALAVAEGVADDERRDAFELEVLALLPTPLSLVDGYSSDRLTRAQRRVVDLAAARGEDADFTVLRSVVFTRLCLNDYDDAATIARRLQAVADRAGEPHLVTEAAYLQGIAAFWAGRLEAARSHFERVVSEYTDDLRTEHLLRYGQDAGLICQSRLANTLRFLGLDEEARSTRDTAVARAVELGHPWTLSLTLLFGATLAIDLGEVEVLADLAARLARVDVPTRPNRLQTRAILGVQRVQAGDPAGGIAEIRGVIDACGAVNPAPAFRSILFRLLVGAHRAAGTAVAGGRDACDEALAVAGTRLWWPDIERARAELA